MKGSVWLLACLLGASASAPADVLLLDAIQSAPPNNTSGVMRPRSGSSMDVVRGGYGEPTSIKGPVGEPPITRWIYDTFTVYFEYDRVIEVVVHR